MTHADWLDVRERLSLLAAAPGAGAVFGSASHGWKLEPPLGAEELVEVEAQLRIELPGEYRSFLLQVGCGGAGPAYGIFPVRRVDGRWQWDGDGAELTDLDTLDQPFPHVEAFNPADRLPAPPDEADFDSIEKFNAAEDAYWKQYDMIVCDPRHSIGLLYLCHLGCAYREALVITGPARGQMWADNTASDAGFEPLYDDDRKPLGFSRWYRRWLDAAEDQLAEAAGSVISSEDEGDAPGFGA
ncbi:SMI1/KNR4 family protein [Nonomuraea dietziae]|uniref:SMI1/KNR4 family protein n=1 Tax=Nonomuraea dietziae TaxID=65515 RepID=UPI0034338D04